MKTAIKILASSLALACACTAAIAQKFDVEIRRTSFGIPHIQAKDYGSIAYGIGYSFAQDNICLLMDELATINGERSLYFGPDATYVYGQRNLNLDFVMKLVNGDAAQVQAGYNAMSAETKAAAVGYVAGVNRWLRDNTANVPAPCKGTPLVRNMTELDMYKLFRRYTLESSYMPFLDGLVAAQPPAIPKAASSGPHDKALRKPLPAEPSQINPQHLYDMNPGFWREVHADWYEGPASNALAVGQDGVESGKSLLLGTPHFPWIGPLRFYQMHLTIPGELNVMGASLAGAPIVNIGFNENVAWSHTNDKAWHFNLYQLQLVPGKPTSYIYDGQERAMTPKTVTVKARSADGTVTDRSTTFWLSHFGPAVVSSQLPIPWTTSFAYVMKDANGKNDRLIDQWLRINRAKSVSDIHTALKDVLGIPWVNTTAVDRDGNAFYSDISATPNISREQLLKCLPDFTLSMVFGLGGPAILRGDTSMCEWQITGSGPKGELMPGEKLPAIYRRDFAHNSNDSFILGNPSAAFNPLDYGPLVGSLEEQGLRTRIGLAQAQARLAGRDGLPGNKFNMQNLQAIALSNRSLGAELFLDDMLRVCTNTDDAVQRACAVLKNWDRKFELTSVGAQVFNEVFPRIARNDATYRTPINWLDPINTPRGLLTEQASVAANVVQAMKDGVAVLDANNIALNKAWGEVHLSLKQGVPNVPGGIVPIPISGGAGSPLGVYNAIYNVRVKDIGYAVVNGTSYIQTVAFDDSGPRAQGFLTYSQSLNPASPYFMDQTMRFSRKQWIDLPFTDAQIRADSNLTTITLRE